MLLSKDLSMLHGQASDPSCSPLFAYREIMEPAEVGSFRFDVAARITLDHFSDSFATNCWNSAEAKPGHEKGSKPSANLNRRKWCC